MGLDIPLWAPPKYTPPDHRIITYKTGFEAGKTGGLNAATDITDNCNDVHLRIIKHPVLMGM